MGVFDAFKREMENFSTIAQFKDFKDKEFKGLSFGFARPREQQSGLERVKDNFATILGDALSFGLDRKAKKNFDEAARANRALFNSEIARANAEAASQEADAVKFDAQFAKENKGS